MLNDRELKVVFHKPVNNGGASVWEYTIVEKVLPLSLVFVSDLLTESWCCSPSLPSLHSPLVSVAYLSFGRYFAC